MTMTETAPIVPSVEDVSHDGALRKQFLKVQEALQTEIFEREAQIEGVLISALARQHYCELGAPGLGKTFTITRFFARLEDVSTSQFLISRYTTDRHLFGPEDVLALAREGRQRRILTGRLADSRFTLLDELWEGRAVLITTHTALSERVYEQEGVNIPIPLRFGCAYVLSNHLPEDSFEATYDRIPQRFVAKPLREPKNRRAMLKAKATGALLPDPPKLLSDELITLAQQQVANVDVPDLVLGTIDTTANRLAEANITMSDRRLASIVALVQATAWLAGRREADVEDVNVMANVAWHDEEQIKETQKIVFANCNPLWAEVAEMASSIGSLAADVAQAASESDPGRRYNHSQKLRDRVVRATEDLKNLSTKAAQKKANPKVQDKLTECRRVLISCTEQVLAASKSATSQ